MDHAPPPEAAPRRRRLILGLRALMLVVLLVGGGLGYFMYRVRVRREAIAAVEAAGGLIQYDDQYKDGKDIPPSRRPQPSWLRRQLGDEHFRHVTRVAFSLQPGASPEARITPEAVAALGRFDRLEYLLIVAIPPGSLSAMERLEPTTTLRSIALNGPGVTDDTLAGVARLRPPKRLFLGGTSVTAAGLARLEASGSLEELSIREMPPPDDAALAAIGRIAPLRRFYLQGAGITDATLPKLVAMSGLRKLFLAGPITDAGLATLATRDDLLSLRVVSPEITDAGLAHLARMKRLESLDVSGPKLTDAGLVHLGGLTQLESLSLGDDGITDAGLAHLRGLPRLKSLDLAESRVTQGGVAALEASRPGLRVGYRTRPPARAPAGAAKE